MLMMRDFLSIKILVYALMGSLSLPATAHSFGNQLHLGSFAADNISLLTLIRTVLIVATRCVREIYIFVKSLWMWTEIVEA
jgi:hypothetical protein